MLRENLGTLLGQISEGRRPLARTAAEAITSPTLLVGGANVQPGTATILSALTQAIGGAERVAIPNAAHTMNVDNPSAFNEAVLRFLARHLITETQQRAVSLGSPIQARKND